MNIQYLKAERNAFTHIWKYIYAMGNSNHMIPYSAICIHYAHPLSKFQLHVSQQLLRYGNP